MPPPFKAFSDKSFTVAYALWLFMGFFGGHRFYLDRVKVGILQFLVLMVNFGVLIYAIYYSFQQDPEQGIVDADPHLEKLFATIGFIFLIQTIWLTIDFFWLYFAIRKEKQNHKFAREQIEAFE
ncbi:NINE protein [Kiloniella antarctica]|uniref:NINE protein n=1 Tax=Kiloniella antarctica TaxID=1550907 RepID=A0ABW5BLS7_9PROT